MQQNILKMQLNFVYVKFLVKFEIFYNTLEINISQARIKVLLTSFLMNLDQFLLNKKTQVSRFSRNRKTHVAN